MVLEAWPAAGTAQPEASEVSPILEVLGWSAADIAAWTAAWEGRASVFGW